MGRDLSRDELAAYVAALAEREDIWRPLVRHDPATRVFESLGLDDHLEVWVISWMPGHDTGFHDHDLSSGAVACVMGQVREWRMRIGAEPASRVVPAGGAFTFAAADIHRVTHEGDAPAATVHAYSPPLRRMGAYVVGEEGALARHPLAYGEELRPLEATG